MFQYLIGGAVVLAVLVLIANLRQKPTNDDNSISVDNDEFDSTVGGDENDETYAAQPNTAAGPRVPLIALTDDNWEALLLQTKSELPIVVEFHTSWCPGCKAQAPIFQRAAAKYATQARFFSADCDDFDHLARVGDVKKIPTTFFIDTGSKTQIVRVGLVKFEEVDEILTALAAKAAGDTKLSAAVGDEDEHPYLLG